MIDRRTIKENRKTEEDMKMKRKVITALLAATMVASLAVGCGNKGGDSKSDSSKSSSSDEITIGFSQVGAESEIGRASCRERV